MSHLTHCRQHKARRRSRRKRLDFSNVYSAQDVTVSFGSPGGFTFDSVSWGSISVPGIPKTKQKPINFESKCTIIFENRQQYENLSGILEAIRILESIRETPRLRAIMVTKYAPTPEFCKPCDDLWVMGYAAWDRLKAQLDERPVGLLGMLGVRVIDDRNVPVSPALDVVAP